MTSKVALSIGLKKAGTLPQLPGAWSGAADFAAWAELAGYDVHKVTDEKDDVTIASLSSLIETLLLEDIDRLLIYFAGHGIATAMGDFWLLSSWEKSSNEAINVNLSFHNARRQPIGQIAVFADACRSTLKDAAFVGGGSIFPRTRAAPSRQPQWDHFLGTRLGEVAQEVRDSDPAKSFGVFSKQLMLALSGSADRAFETRAEGRRVVSSPALATWLEEVVPLESGKIAGAMVQFPDLNPSWRPPENVYHTLEATAAMASRPEPDDPISPGERDRLEGTGEEGPTASPSWSSPRPRSWQHSPDSFRRVAAAAQARLDRRRLTVDRLSASQGRRSFETRMGFTVIGADFSRAVVQAGQTVEDFGEDGLRHIRCYGSEPMTVGLALDDGRFAAMLAIPEFVGVITFDEAGLWLGLDYVPAANSHIFARFAENADHGVAEWTAAAAAGGSIAGAGFAELDARLSRDGYLNPALAILAAYSFERAGRFDDIDAVADRLIAAGQSVPFDVARLASLPDRTAGQGAPDSVAGISAASDLVVAGTFPLMTRGWSYLSEEAGDGRLLSLREGLQPSLWTMFDRQVGERVADMITQGYL